MPPERTIIFGPGDKLAWLEAIASDRHATAFDARVSVALSNRLDKYTGRAVIGQAWVATYVGGTDRGVRASTERLERLGHLFIDRTEVRNDKGVHFGGRGKSNVYVPVKVKREVGNGDSAFRAENPEPANTKTRNAAAGNPERERVKPGTAIPPFPNTYLNSTCDPNSGDAENEDTHWRQVKDALLGLGVSNAERVSWIDCLTFEGVDADVALLRAPTKFIRDRINQSIMHEHLKRAWQRVLPAIARVDIRATNSAQQN